MSIYAGEIIHLKDDNDEWGNKTYLKENSQIKQAIFIFYGIYIYTFDRYACKIKHWLTEYVLLTFIFFFFRLCRFDKQKNPLMYMYTYGMCQYI